jgi:glycosyltransferase involved in cell wall biosynthesis
MKLLVLAQTPPPVHGQSLMVQALVGGLAGRAGIELRHVNLPLSRDAADIGRMRPGKIWTLYRACRRARRLAVAEGIDTLYYVPAPGKRSAVFRDWIAMGMCRSCFRRLILHWHAPGLGEWLPRNTRPPAGALTHRLLDRADLSIVLTDALRTDAEAFAARRIAVVPNGIPDPCPDWTPRTRDAGAPFQVAFLGLCSEEKGLFDAAGAVIEANRLTGAPPDRPAFVLAAAGEFPARADEARFRSLAGANPLAIRHLGFVDGAAKHQLLAGSDCLGLPTRYPHEGQPLVLLEAMAHDLPVIATRWRGIPDTLSPATSRLVPPGDVAALAGALMELRPLPPPAGAARSFFKERYTLERHLDHMAAALRAS